MSTLRPRATSLRIASQEVFRFPGSRPFSGSSRIRYGQSVDIAMASFTCCFIPVESLRVGLSRYGEIPRESQSESMSAADFHASLTKARCSMADSVG